MTMTMIMMMLAMTVIMTMVLTMLGAGPLVLVFYISHKLSIGIGKTIRVHFILATMKSLF